MSAKNVNQPTTPPIMHYLCGERVIKSEKEKIEEVIEAKKQSVVDTQDNDEIPLPDDEYGAPAPAEEIEAPVKSEKEENLPADITPVTEWDEILQLIKIESTKLV